MLSEGDLVTPTVRLVRPLAQGGMGSVWIADHLALGTQVAVKLMTESHAATEGARARFTSEAMAAARVKSPHIVQVFDHGLAPTGEPFIVMELLDGRDLRDHLQAREVLPLPELVDILNQACRGLTKAHAAGIVHRDIKPDNLFLLEPDGERFVKILDFGVAKQRASGDSLRMTATGTMVGTPYYMSPEQALGLKTIDFATDLWSLAVVAYQCVVGSLPFSGETVGALFVAIDRADFAPPSLLLPGLAPEVDAFFVTALARRPADRFSSARAFAEAFERAALGREPAASEPSLVAARSGSFPDAGPALALPQPASPLPGARAEEISLADTAAVAEAARSSTFDAHASGVRGDAATTGAAMTAASARREKARWIVAGGGLALAAAVVVALVTRGSGDRASGRGQAAGLVASGGIAPVTNESVDTSATPSSTVAGSLPGPSASAENTPVVTPIVTPVASASAGGDAATIAVTASTARTKAPAAKGAVPSTKPTKAGLKAPNPLGTVDRGF